LNGENARIFTCDQGEGTAIVFHDSFGAFLTPLLSESFGQTVFYATQVNKLSEEDLDALFETYHPQVIIEELVERAFIPDQES
jgi:hypothetical protein